MIPKVIHYCWFGNAKFSSIHLSCIDSWKKHLPDYEFKLWNETNVDMNHPFISFAYKHKKWAFVADYVRLKKLYEYGGVYLDTDMFLIKNIDVFLKHKCFISAENNSTINAAIFGAVKNNDYIKDCLSSYEIEKPELWQLRFSIPRIMTRNITGYHELVPMFYEIMIKKEVTIYPKDYFYPMPYKINKGFEKDFLKYKKKETYAIHLWDGSWVEYTEFQLLLRKSYKAAFIKIFTASEQKKDFKYFFKIFKTIIKSILVK